MTLGLQAPASEGPAAGSVPAVELRDVFRVHRTAQGDAAALAGATFEVGRGELLCVLGRSGAGKSTMLRVIAGLEPPSAGVVRVLGRDIGRLSGRRRAALRRATIGFLDQHPERALPPDLPASRCIALPLALRGVGRRAAAARATELLEATGMRDRSSALAAELSGGELQRVALGMALAHRPALLLADEPTGELDGQSARAVRSLLAALARSEGATVIVVSHDPEAAAGSDRTLLLRDGRVGEERLGGEELAVVGRAGWIGLPPVLLTRAGIDARARVSQVAGGVLVGPAGSGTAPAVSPPGLNPSAPTLVRATPAPVEVRGISIGYGRGHIRRQVLRDFSATVAPGLLTVVTGRSGVGKSTLLRLVAGLERPDEGEILIDGRPLGGLDAEQLAALRRARIGYVSQRADAVAFLAADENIVLALTLRGHDRSRALNLAAAALARFDLAERAHQRVGRLSAGEQQRVATARALATANGLLIADEPTSRLDEATAAAVAERLAEAAAAGQTVICATNDPFLIDHADEHLRLDR